VAQFHRNHHIAINPATSINLLDEILPEIDMVVVMAVNPGISGQSFIESTLDKVTRLTSGI
jgi:ribulose-phosphate 3-epimerase